MCGIAGVLRLDGSPASDAPVRAMAESLRHRGPDRRTTHRSPSGCLAFGHSRLRVIDPETGEQPMANEDETVWVVFNGEIYNFRSLRRELESRGHRFRTGADTEVIVHGWEEWGSGVVGRLDGMFAFAVWDEARRRLLLARDRAGQKPLFLHRDAAKLVFASEIKGILAHGEVDAPVDPGPLPLYLAYGYVPGSRTFYRGIRELPPGTLLEAAPDGPAEERRYWSLDFDPEPDDIPEPEAARRVRELVGAAVERRLVADVPLGAFLSGGIDSTVIVGLMAERLREPVRTFSIGFEGDPTYDETRYARLAAERFGTDHTEFVVGPGSIDLIDRLVTAYDEPFGDSSAIPTHIVSGLTREHVTVALTGDGGDEVFAGYLRFYGAVLAERLPSWLIGLGDAIGRRLPHDPDFRSLTRRFSRFFRAAALPLDERLLRWVGIFADEVGGLLRPGLAEALRTEELTAPFRRCLETTRHLSPLQRVLHLNYRTYLPDDLLVKTDRCSMAHGLELRSPFLDTAVVEHAATLPDRLKLQGRTTKHILREAFRDLLPDEVANRGKMGFGIPLPTWLRNEWRPLVEDRLLRSDARIYEWLRPDPVREMAESHFEGGVDHGHRLWTLLTLETWLSGR